MKYDHTIDEKSFAMQTTHGQILNLIRKNSKVLDIGCSTGFLGKYLKENKKCKLIGIEKEPAAAEIASAFYDRIICGSIEDEKILSGINETFDFIILADVIEHLADAEKLLKRIKELLNPDGGVLISIPNIANWKIRLGLLLGKFDYEDAGILDRTHLKFFTFKSAKELFSLCGYDICYFRGAGTRMPVILRKLRPALFAAQFVFEIKAK